MANDFERGIRVYLDTSDYGKGLEEMAAATKEYAKELDELNKQAEDMAAAGKKGSKEWEKLQKQIVRKEKQLKQVTTAEGKYRQKLEETERTLKNLSGATYNDLIAARKQLRSEMQKTERSSLKYKAAHEQLLRVDKELAKAQRDLNSQVGCQGTFIGKLANGVNKYMALIGGGIATITGLSMTFRRLAEEVAHMDDVYSDVMKTTGMSREEVEELNEELKKMDTRTSREELNLLARDAGKLGLESKKDILDFVDAGNQIRIALGEDLGKDAITSIGKMTDVFAASSRELDGLDLKGRMLAVGSAVNELGASSTASEPYLVDFAGRLGGVAKQANISMSAILGYGSALDENMQQVEMSATALQNFILSMMTEPAKFARIAGMEVEQFSTLLSTDANEAIKTVLRSMNERGGFQELAPVFKEMGTDGARAVGVLSTLAGNLDKVEKAQRIASEAMMEGTSLTNEYGIKNSNLQAELEKARKEFKETALELGQRLSPALMVSTKGTTYLIKALVELIPWMSKHKSFIVSLTVAFGAYLVAYNKAFIVEKARHALHPLLIASLKLKVALTNQATVAEIRLAKAQTKLNAAMKKNLWGLIAAAIAFAVTKLIDWMEKTKEVSKAQEIHNGILEKEQDLIQSNSESTLQERSELESLVTAISNTNDNEDLRRRLLDELNKKYPDFLGHIDKEKVTNEQLYAALADVNNQYMLKLKNAALSGKAQAYDDAAVKAMQRQIEIQEELKFLYSDVSKDHSKRINELKKEDKQLQTNIAEYRKKSAGYRTEMQNNLKALENMNTSSYYQEQIRVWEESMTHFENLRAKAIDRGSTEEKKYYEGQIANAEKMLAYSKSKYEELKKAEEAASKAGKGADKGSSGIISPGDDQQKAIERFFERHQDQDRTGDEGIRRPTEGGRTL